ncbi:MAG: TonB C-terminal domain-containing protein [Alphaproteobacteria bacterium]|nr:TonB C-terminal domain-containing protein [Alphaproteobacteria bacterium]
MLLKRKPIPTTEKLIIIDLEHVEIGQKTVIPKKAKNNKKKEKTPSKKSSKKLKKTQKEAKKIEKKSDKKPHKKTSKKKSVATPIKKNAPKQETKTASTSKSVSTKKDKKSNLPPKDFKPPERPKSLVRNRKPETKKKKKKAKEIDPLKSLLASVEKMENEFKEDKPEKQPEEDKKEPDNNDVEGIDTNKVTISEIDLIRTQIKQCWNIDPGARGISNMVVEVTVSLTSDGSVIDVRIVDMQRYNSDSFFRSLADSAKRAVHVCSPLRVPIDKYEAWKEMRLYFNPLDGGIL